MSSSAVMLGGRTDFFLWPLFVRLFHNRPTSYKNGNFGNLTSVSNTGVDEVSLTSSLLIQLFRSRTAAPS